MSSPHRKDILVVCTLRIGDVLLTTPLIRSLRAALPGSRIDVLVLPGMEGVLEGNSDVNRVLVSPHRSGVFSRLKEMLSLWRRYDVALTTVSSDRARLYCFIASGNSAGPYNLHSSRLSVRLLANRVLFDDLHTHTVVMGLKVLDLLGLPRQYDVIPPTAGGAIPEELRSGRYAVLHPFPKFRYKMWPQSHWAALVEALQLRGWKVALTGGSAPDEIRYVEQIAQSGSAFNLSGKLSLAQTADLIAQAGLFVGPDTGITHVAAATGTRTLALFGPSNPEKWGPWPAGFASEDSPWPMKGSRRVGNVSLVQGEGDCVPCREEGCEKHRLSFSRCLDTLGVDRVLQEIDTFTATPSDAG